MYYVNIIVLYTNYVKAYIIVNNTINYLFARAVYFVFKIKIYE